MGGFVLGARRKLVVVLSLGCWVAAMGLVTGCGSGGAHMPRISTSAQVVAGGHKVTIGVESRGSGYGIGQIALTYPNGHRRATGEGLLMDGVGWSVTCTLRPGDYEYTLYAVARKSAPKSPIFPDGARTKQNAVASGSFTIH